MPILLFVSIVFASVSLATYFVLRDAQKFAVAPPAPLIDLDRMYDVIFSQLDEATAKAITPKDLETILQSFVTVLSEHNLIKETIVPETDTEDIGDTLSVEVIAHHILQKTPDLDVERAAVENVVDATFVYLRDIKAIVA